MSTGPVTGIDRFVSMGDDLARPSDKVTGQGSQSHAFDDVFGQFVESSADANTQDQRLEALRSTIENMDESEVVGFLAMLENQSGWQPNQHALAEVIDLQAWRQKVQSTLDPVKGDASSLYASSRDSLSEAAQSALSKAMEQMLPGGSAEQKQGAHVLDQTAQANSQNRTSDTLSHLLDAAATEPRRQAALDSKLVSDITLGTELMTNQGARSTADAQLQTLILNAPAVAQRTDTSVPQNGLNPTVAQTATQGNPSISLRQEGWSEALGQRLVAMVGEGRQEARLRLDPPELGTIGIKLVIEESGVNVQFASSTAQVRDMLVAQSDRLRFALENQGHQQVNVNVGSDAEGQFAQQDQASGGSTDFSASGELAQQQDYLASDDEAEPLSSGWINTFA